MIIFWCICQLSVLYDICDEYQVIYMSFTKLRTSSLRRQQLLLLHQQYPLHMTLLSLRMFKHSLANLILS